MGDFKQETVDNPILTLQGINKHFRGLHALADVSVAAYAGKIVGLLGPNGSGKTTLLNILSGVYTPDTGSGRLADRDYADLWGQPSSIANAGLARTFQSVRLLEGRSVFENVLLGAHLSQRSSFLATLLRSSASRGELGEVDRLVRTALDTVGLAGQADEQVDSLPYGIRRKVEIARAMVRSPSVLLLDEPTAGMAASERDDIFQLVRKLSAKGVAVVVVEHDVMSMTTHCDLVVVLNFGHVVAVGAPNEVMREEAVIDAYIGRAAHR